MITLQIIQNWQSPVTVDGQKITDPNAQITPAAGMTIQVGKRKFAKLKIN